MPEEKTIHDPVHGSMVLSGIVLDLIDTVEVQRLRGIRQLGLANIAFPGANHSRFEHAIGVSHLAWKVSNNLGLDKKDGNLLQSAALLHDVGHAPYSHTLEHLMVDFLKKDHMEITGEIIQGNLNLGSELEKNIKLKIPRAYQVLRKWGVPADEVSQILVGKHRRKYLGELLHSEVDVDQMDYLLRDSHYTGVALGMIDVDRLMRTLVVHKGSLHILGKGVEAVEGLITARGLMYTSVYYHHTVRVAEIMLENAVDRALEMGGPEEAKKLFFMNDSQLIENLSGLGGYPAELVLRLKYRRLFKPAYVEAKRDLSKVQKGKYMKNFGKWGDIRKTQDEIAEASGLERGQVLLDVPIVDILISEPRLEKVEMPVLAIGNVRKLSDVSPLALALKRRQAPRYLLRVLTDPKNMAKVKRASEKILD